LSPNSSEQVTAVTETLGAGLSLAMGLAARALSDLVLPRRPHRSIPARRMISPGGAHAAQFRRA
jgi:hypothetical protein